MSDLASGAAPLQYATAGGAQYGSLDLSDKRDLATVREARRKRFPVTKELAQLCVDVAHERLADPGEDNPHIYIADVIAMERVNQADDHATLKPSSQTTINNTQVNISQRFESMLSDESARLLSDMRAMLANNVKPER